MDATGTGPGDAGLVARCLRGDQAALRSLYLAHAGRVKAYFRRSGFADADAEDLTQETFLRAFKSLGGFDAARGALGPWLAAIARNAARKRWARRPEPDSFDPELAEQVLELADNPSGSTETREQLDALAGCLAKLPRDLAEVLRLRYVEARTTRGVAAATGLAEATVRLRLAKALGLIERCMRTKGMLD